MKKVDSEGAGLGCLVLFYVPLLVFFCAYAAHCGWRMGQ